MSRTPARCRASSVRTTWVCSAVQNARRARLSASTMSPTSTIRAASTPCRNSFSSRTRACRNPRWRSERNRVRAVVLPVRVGLPFAMAFSHPQAFESVPRVVRQRVGSVTAQLRVSYELGSCAENLSRCGSQGAKPRRDPLGREMAGEGAAAAERALHFERRPVALQYVLDDREPESRAPGGARAPGVDAVETLGEAGYVLGRNAHPGVAHREMPAVLIHPPPHLERAFGRGVLGGVVDQVGKRRVDLGLIAHEVRV